jgi:hypothetical protein
MKRSLCRRAALLAPRAASSVAPVASGYEPSLRPCLGTTIAPLRRATFHQSLLEQDLGGDLGRAPSAADEVDREVEVGVARREPLGEGQGVAGLHQHVEPPALHLAALVLVPFVEKRQLIHAGRFSL